MPERGRFVAVEVAESEQLLRMALRVGEILPVGVSAAGRAMLPCWPPARQAAMLQDQPTAADLVEFEATRQRGFGLSICEVLVGSTNLAGAHIR